MNTEYPFLEKYCINPLEINTTDARRIGKSDHLFFPIPMEDLEEVREKYQPFPKELEMFYQNIGFGFMYRRKGKIRCLLDPMSLLNVNSQSGIYADDPVICKALEYIQKEEQLLFFKADESHYFSINRTSSPKGNAVYYKGYQVTESLFDFLNFYWRNDMALAYFYDKVEKQMSHKKQNYIEEFEMFPES